ncbi:MAG: U32 family peptidase [Candidatus Gallimonas sp.]
MNQKPELLAPAGNLQKLKTAFYFGADAVYLGGKQFSLRTFADNFTEEELAEGVRYAHERGKKAYACANIFARNADFARLPDYFVFLREIGIDAVLISDPGVFRVCRKAAPDLPVHVSTQANTTNAQSAAMWKELGASRVVLARELSLGEIAQIHAENPDLELEAFVHGAMCISYSGRCLLSDYLDGRSSNRGACAQACRYEYELRARDREDKGWLALGEDGKGTYFLNSKDLNMSAHLASLAAAGVVSFKIEGRMKSEYYLATVVNAYRRILDGGDLQALGEELSACAHRDYTTAYMLGGNTQTVSREDSQTKGTCEFIAVVKGSQAGRVIAEMRGRFYEGEELEILSPGRFFAKKFTVARLCAQNGEPCADAKRVQEQYSFDCPYPLAEGDILRRRREKHD